MRGRGSLAGLHRGIAPSGSISLIAIRPPTAQNTANFFLARPVWFVDCTCDGYANPVPEQGRAEKTQPMNLNKPALSVINTKGHFVPLCSVPRAFEGPGWWRRPIKMPFDCDSACGSPPTGRYRSTLPLPAARRTHPGSFRIAYDQGQPQGGLADRPCSKIREHDHAERWVPIIHYEDPRATRMRLASWSSDSRG